jgi:hypothetical protein
MFGKSLFSRPTEKDIKRAEFVRSLGFKFSRGGKIIPIKHIRRLHKKQRKLKL